MDKHFKELKELFDDFSINYAKYLLDNSCLNELKEIVNKIEMSIKNITTITNFSHAQKIVHDLSIKLPTSDSKTGKFDAEELGKWIKGVNEIVTTAKPGAFETVGYDVVAIAPGSSILLCDFSSKSNTLDDSALESLSDTKNTLISILENSKSFSTPGYTPDKLKDFCEKTNLDEDKAYKISKTLSELFPGPNSTMEEIELTVNSESGSVNRDFKKEERIRSIKTKQDIYQTIKPAEIEELTGKLGIMEEWDENHKISIIEEDTFKVFTTNYEPNKDNLKIIKDNIGKRVTIKRSKSEDDKRKWFLDEWVHKV